MKYLRDHWDLISYRVLSEARSENRQLYIGFAWWILEPAAYMAVLYLVFGVVLQRGGPGYAGFLLVGFVFWRWMDGSIKKAGQSLLSAKMILTQVKLAHWIFPLSEVLTGALRFLVVLTLLIGFAVLYTGQAGSAYLALPALLALNLVFIFALGLLLACIVPFFPDSRKIIDNLFQLLFFCSGIFFDISKLDASSAQLLYLNPFASFLSAYRQIMLDGQFPSMAVLYSPLLATVILVALASVTYKSVHEQLPKALLR